MELIAITSDYKTITTDTGTYTWDDYSMVDMDWRKLYFGNVPVSDMRKYTPAADWQSIRLSMKGSTLKFKFTTLCWWLKHKEFDYASRIQVTNYVTALSRGGLIKPEDYRKEVA